MPYELNMSADGVCPALCGLYADGHLRVFYDGLYLDLEHNSATNYDRIKLDSCPFCGSMVTKEQWKEVK